MHASVHESIKYQSGTKRKRRPRQAHYTNTTTVRDTAPFSALPSALPGSFSCSCMGQAVGHRTQLSMKFERSPNGGESLAQAGYKLPCLSNHARAVGFRTCNFEKGDQVPPLSLGGLFISQEECSMYQVMVIVWVGICEGADAAHWHTTSTAASQHDSSQQQRWRQATMLCLPAPPGIQWSET